MTPVIVSMYCILGSAIIVLVTFLLTIILTKYAEKEMQKYKPFVYLGRLDDTKANDDIYTAVKYLELTNSINSNK